MIKPNEYRAMLAEADDEIKLLRGRVHDLIVRLAGVQSESRYKDTIIAKREVQISELRNQLRETKSLGGGFKA